MTKHQLKADNRTVSGRAVKHLRAKGFTPANIFGKKVASLAIQINTKDFSKLFTQVGESTLIYLEVAGEKESRPVLVREVMNHPVTGLCLHVSFNQVDLKEKVTAPVSIELVGEAPAETNHLGILVQQLNEVEVEALPAEMPEGIQLDLSSLTEVGSQLLVSDIKVAKNIAIQTPADTLVAKIEPLAKEEIVEAPTAEGEAAVPAEGEAAAPAEGDASPAAEK